MSGHMYIHLCCVAFVGVCGEYTAWLLVICLSWHRQLQLATSIPVMIIMQSIYVNACSLASSLNNALLIRIHMDFRPHVNLSVLPLCMNMAHVQVCLPNCVILHSIIHANFKPITHSRLT